MHNNQGKIRWAESVESMRKQIILGEIAEKMRACVS
jgi:hypothetical protein